MKQMNFKLALVRMHFGICLIILGKVVLNSDHFAVKRWLHLLLKDHDLSYCNCSDLCIFVYTCAFTYTSIHVSVYVQRYTSYLQIVAIQYEVNRNSYCIWQTSPSYAWFIFHELSPGCAVRHLVDDIRSVPQPKWGPIHAKKPPYK